MTTNGAFLTMSNIETLSKAWNGVIGSSSTEPVPPITLIIYIIYLTFMWGINIMMILKIHKGLVDQASRRFTTANILLASGDTAMFLCFALAIFLNIPMGKPAPPGTLPLEVAGLITTSLTMSCYYLFLGYYVRERFQGRGTYFLMVIVYILFVVRIAYHYNPNNIWLSMVLPPGKPNYSAWTRNVPLIIYGLLVVLCCLIYSIKDLGHEPRKRRFIMLAMLSLIGSFIFYILDVYFAHRIPHSVIWIIYTLKTIMYVLAAVFMYKADFQVRSAKT